MRVNDDFSQRVVQRPAEARWTDAPVPGIRRRMLERRGGEIARATTVVRYEAGSRFPGHVHGGGEEFLVLEGVFSDEHGDYPAGVYVRNPPGSRHAPWSGPGCTLFVKLWQFAPDDLEPVIVDTRNATWPPGPAADPAALPLHRHGAVRTELLRWVGAGSLEIADAGGVEIYVLAGSLAKGDWPTGTWVRDPAVINTQVDRGGALIWVRRGHLRGPTLAGSLADGDLS